MAYESRKLTAAERNYPAHILELLAVVHALRAFRHYLLGGGALWPAGCCSDFDLRTDNQVITWLKTNRHLNKIFVRWLDEIKDFRFDVTHLPGLRNPTDPLPRRGFADGYGPATSTGDADAESQQELFSRLGRDAPASALLDAVRTGRRGGPALAIISAVCARWAVTRCEAAATFSDVQGGDAIPSAPPGGCYSPCHSMFIALAGAKLSLGTGTTPAPSPPVPSDDLFLSQTFVQTLATELAVDASFGPSCAALLRHSASLWTGSADQSLDPPARRRAGHSWCGAVCCTAAGRARQTASVSPPVLGCALRCYASATTARSGGTSAALRRGRWCVASPSGWARTSTSPSTCARARRASAPKRSTAAHVGSSTRFHCHRSEAG